MKNYCLYILFNADFLADITKGILPVNSCKKTDKFFVTRSLHNNVASYSRSARVLSGFN